MKKIKDYLIIALIFVAVFGFIGGCTMIDYKVFKNKYPNAGFLSYVWHEMTHRR